MVVRMRETKKAFGGVTVPSEIRFTGKLLATLQILFMLVIILFVPFFLYILSYRPDVDFDRAYDVFFLGLAPWWILLIITLFVWIYKSAKNKYYITGNPLTYTGFIGPKMSVVFFAVPLVNLFMPFFVVREIWTASSFGGREKNGFFAAAILVGWGSYVLFCVAGYIVGEMESDSLVPHAALLGVLIFSWVFFIYIFIKLTNFQLKAVAQKQNAPFKKLGFPLLWVLTGVVLMACSLYSLAVSQKKTDEQMLKEAYEFYGGENEDLDEAFRYFSILAERGNGEGAYRLGECYEYGYGIEADPKKAFDSYLKGAQSGNADAQNSVGLCYYSGKGIAANLREAVKWFRDSARQNQITACGNLGYIYSNRDEVLDLDEARKFYLKAAKLGDSNAKFELYKLMLEDDPASENSKEAVEWLKKAAEDNDIDAVNVLGVLYYEGVYVEEDDDKAVELLRHAAKEGSVAAKYNLGYIYFYDENLKDDAKAYEYLKSAADGEYESAYILLSRFYAEGIVAEKDVARAVELLKKAGDNPDAYFRLGIVYEAEGDAAKSKEWLKKAADMGHEKAAEKLRAPDKELGQ